LSQRPVNKFLKLHTVLNSFFTPWRQKTKYICCYVAS